MPSPLPLGVPLALTFRRCDAWLGAASFGGGGPSPANEREGMFAGGVFAGGDFAGATPGWSHSAEEEDLPDWLAPAPRAESADEATDRAELGADPVSEATDVKSEGMRSGCMASSQSSTMGLFQPKSW